MIYADYARRKMHNVVKLGTAEGYPLVINNAEGKKLKDYTIEGNTEYGENLFNYDTKANGFTVDKDGWMTTTLDNTTGTNVKYRWVSDKPCTLIKPDTNYYIYTQIETFDVESTPAASDTGCYLYAKSEPNATAANSQFVKPSLRYKAAGIYKATITSRSDFSGCTNMLRTFLNAPPGVKITVKFRIAVYEAEKDVFLPYTKTSVGDLTGNLFNYTEPYDNDQIKADENGWIDVTVDNTDGTATKYVPCYTSANNKLKPNTEYTILCEVLERSGNVILYVVNPYTTATTGGQFTTLWTATQNNGVALVSRKTRESFKNCNSMLRTVVYADAGKSGHIKFRIAVYEAEKGYFEPYGKYKIPVLVNGENNTNIYLDAPVADGESINYRADNLPDIVPGSGTNTITTDTAVKPKKILAKYYKK